MKHLAFSALVLCAACGSKGADSSKDKGGDKADKADKGPKSDTDTAKEAHLQLNKIGKNAKVFFVTEAKFPEGKSSTLPEKACCTYPDHKCPPTQAWMSDKLFMALDFQIDEPNHFQYSVESDGKTLTGTATGDPDCSGTTVTYKVELTAEGGNPVMKFSE